MREDWLVASGIRPIQTSGRQTTVEFLAHGEFRLGALVKKGFVVVEGTDEGQVSVLSVDDGALLFAHAECWRRLIL